MEWKEFIEKYKSYKDGFNSQSYEERVKVSRLMAYDAIAELIRSKKHLKEVIDKINERINTLSKELDEGIKNQSVV